MDTVTIGSATYDVYADVSVADMYLDAAIHAETWWTLDTDTKARALVTATRTLDRQTWLEDYSTQALREDIDNIINASIELALSLAEGSDVQNQQTTAERVKRLQAGSVSIENFRGIDNPTRFPQIVQELLRGYLGSDGSNLVGVAEGTDGETIFPIDLGFTG